MAKDSEAANSMVMRKWQAKLDRMNAEAENAETGMKTALKNILKHKEVKQALEQEKNASIRRSEQGMLSPMERALIGASRSGGSIGYANLESDMIDYNEVISKPWEKD